MLHWKARLVVALVFAVAMAATLPAQAQNGNYDYKISTSHSGKTIYVTFWIDDPTWYPPANPLEIRLQTPHLNGPSGIFTQANLVQGWNTKSFTVPYYGDWRVWLSHSQGYQYDYAYEFVPAPDETKTRIVSSSLYNSYVLASKGTEFLILKMLSQDLLLNKEQQKWADLVALAATTATSFLGSDPGLRPDQRWTYEVWTVGTKQYQRVTVENKDIYGNYYVVDQYQNQVTYDMWPR